MKPDEPLERLKPERIQEPQPPRADRSLFARAFALLKRVETWTARLLSLFGRGRRS